MEMLRTALVVDDDHLEREYMSELLSRNGFVVRASASVPDASALVRGMRFDCFFIDDRMAGYDGVTALGALLRAGSQEPVTILLGDPRDRGPRHYRENGFQFFLEKPVTERALRRVLLGEEVEAPGRAGEREPSADPAAPARPQEAGALDLPGLNVSEGLGNCGSRENYLEALRIFFDTLEAKAGEIERYYAEEDWKDYTIKVHALKSNARIIGADALADLAAALESAGKAGDLERIRRDTGTLLQQYRETGAGLSALFREGGAERPAADRATIADALGSIAEFAEMMDYDMVEMVLASMEELSLPPEEAARFGRIRQALMGLDWEGIRREVRGGEA